MEIYDYIAADSPQNARLTDKRIHKAIDSLDFLPQRFEVYENNDNPAEIVYSMSLKPFAIYYIINDVVLRVSIITVRHGARDRPPRFFR